MRLIHAGPDWVIWLRSKSDVIDQQYNSWPFHRIGRISAGVAAGQAAAASRNAGCVNSGGWRTEAISRRTEETSRARKNSRDMAALSFRQSGPTISLPY